MNPFFIITRYKEDYSWIKEYTNENYIIFNKSEPIENDTHVFNVPNTGGNIRDIPYFIYANYDNLPEIMIFCQSYPYDHCRKDVFDELINNKEFTSLEYCGNTPANGWENRTSEGEFLEINNNWYIDIINNQHNQSCKYSSFDELMSRYFENYEHVDWIRFAPGAQYLITKDNASYYPKKFWEILAEEMNTTSFCTESYIFERAMWYILNNIYVLRKEFYEQI